MTSPDQPPNHLSIEDTTQTKETNAQVASTSTQMDDLALHLPVDIEHGGIRLAGCSTFFITSGAIFIITSALAPEASLLLLFFSILLASGITYSVDLFLKGRWLSGRELLVNSSQIILQNTRKIETVIQRNDHANVLFWRFEVMRTGRVKRGWYVLAVALEQDGNYLIVYSFCSPETWKELNGQEHFANLERKKQKNNALDSKRDMKLAGEQKRLQDAENVRGYEGGELTFENFLQYLDYLLSNQKHWL